MPAPPTIDLHLTRALTNIRLAAQLLQRRQAAGDVPPAEMARLLAFIVAQTQPVSVATRAPG